VTVQPLIPERTILDRDYFGFMLSDPYTDIIMEYLEEVAFTVVQSAKGAILVPMHQKPARCGAVSEEVTELEVNKKTYPH
jgi:hypothetical protein